MAAKKSSAPPPAVKGGKSSKTAKKKAADPAAPLPTPTTGPADPPKPLPAGRPATVVRHSDAFREELKASGRALFLSYPKHVQPKSAVHTTQLVKFLQGSMAARGVEFADPSANSFMAVMYTSVQLRESAIEILRKEKLPLPGTKKLVDPNVQPYGIKPTPDRAPSVWVIPGLKRACPPERLAAAVRQHARDSGVLSEATFNANFDIRWLEDSGFATLTGLVS